jgi:hypothetical protein
MLPMVCRSLLPPAYGGQRSVSRWENFVELCREGASRRGGITGWVESCVEPPVCTGKQSMAVGGRSSAEM